MTLIKQYYKLIVLLICVGAFPANIAAFTTNTNIDSSICTFHGSKIDEPSKILIKCDHCDYFVDLDFDQININSYQIESSNLLDSLYQSFHFIINKPSHVSRSPPLV